MKKTARWQARLRQVEAFVFFAAMLLAITLEAACVYWLGAPGTTRAPAGMAPNLIGQWTAATLPQCWLLGALLVLLHRITAMLLPPQNWDWAKAQSNRRAFLHLWGWTVALGASQAGALYLDHLTRGAQ